MNAAEIRLLFTDETSIRRLTSSSPPISQNVNERNTGTRIVYEVRYEEEPADRIGQSLSAELLALVGGIRADFVSYGPRHPIRRAIAEWDRACRRRHRLPTWTDHATPICGPLLRAVIEGGASVRWCAERWGLSYGRAERLIGMGLSYVGDQIQRAEEAQQGQLHDRDHCEICLSQASEME